MSSADDHHVVALAVPKLRDRAPRLPRCWSRFRCDLGASRFESLEGAVPGSNTGSSTNWVCIVGPSIAGDGVRRRPLTKTGKLTPGDETPTARVSVPSVDASLGMNLLPAVLSLTAGSVDVISFLGLGGLFTGNLVILASRIVAGGETPVAPMLSVPVFMVVLGLTRLLVGGLESIGLASLQSLLLLQLLLLAGFFVLCVAAGPRIDPNTAGAILSGMLGVSAMAVQNALVQVSLKGAPSTAVMTTNVTRFRMDLGEVLLGHDPDDVA